MDVWTRVPKPTESSIIIASLNAQPFGLLIALTSVVSSDISSVTSGWGNIAKPVGSTWTTVSKPTNSVWTNVNKPTS